MKRWLLLFSALLYHVSVIAQVDTVYEALIAKGSLFHLQKDHRNAIDYFEKAFRIHQPDALNAYKLAGAYSLAKNPQKAFFYLELSLEGGWTEAEYLSTDEYFDEMKKSFPDRWKRVEDLAFDKERRYGQSLAQAQLRKEINRMTLNDQKLRFKRIQAADQKDKEAIDREIQQADAENYKQVVEIINKYGWPGGSDIGKDGQNNLWLLVQHADHDVRFQKLALTKMKVMLDKKEADPENYAFLYDRVQCNLNYKQLYGTQVIWGSNGTASGFRPIIKENDVDKRRSALGLLPLSVYSLSYGFSYTPVDRETARNKDQSDLKNTKALIDSALTFYGEKEFQKVYDYYNAASTIQGGMSDKQNYKAAVLLANIYNTNGEEKYKSISLDFLNLLYLRGALSTEKLEHKKAFERFHGERRWAEMRGPY